MSHQITQTESRDTLLFKLKTLNAFEPISQPAMSIHFLTIRSAIKMLATSKTEASVNVRGKGNMS